MPGMMVAPHSSHSHASPSRMDGLTPSRAGHAHDGGVGQCVCRFLFYSPIKLHLSQEKWSFHPEKQCISVSSTFILPYNCIYHNKKNNVSIQIINAYMYQQLTFLSRHMFSWISREFIICLHSENFSFLLWLCVVTQTQLAKNTLTQFIIAGYWRWGKTLWKIFQIFRIFSRTKSTKIILIVKHFKNLSIMILTIFSKTKFRKIKIGKYFEKSFN